MLFQSKCRKHSVCIALLPFQFIRQLVWESEFAWQLMRWALLMAGSRPINMFTDQRPRMEIPTMQIQIQYEWDGNTYNTNTNTICMGWKYLREWLVCGGGTNLDWMEERTICGLCWIPAARYTYLPKYLTMYLAIYLIYLTIFGWRRGQSAVPAESRPLDIHMHLPRCTWFT